MPKIWSSLKKTLHCKSKPSEVHEPKSRTQFSTILRRKRGRSGCSRSIANLKEVVIHGSNRHIGNEKPPNCSPRSIGSSEFLNPITHEVILSDSMYELKITSFGGGGGGGGGGSGFVGTLRPGTPGPGGHSTMHSLRNNNSKPIRKSHFRSSGGFGGGDGGGGGGENSSRRVALETNSNGCYTCHKCGEEFTKWKAAEAHHLSKHAVTELEEGDSSRKILEIICRTSSLNSENHCVRIERVLKVHNTKKTLAQFEEHREMVKNKASKLPKKHSRCIADGNELLRFHGTTVSCSLGLNGSSTLCVSEKCRVCRITRHGFSSLKEGIGIFTTSTSGRAFEAIEIIEVDGALTRKALIVCRVIAGRVHKPVENMQEMAAQTGFDSLVGKVGVYASIEELFLLNPRALLPCFVVICRN